METKFNFDSSPCTSKEQSERLLALGIKKETADMFYSTILENDDIARVCWEDFWNSSKVIDGYIKQRCIPAWSLNRIRELLKKSQVTLSFFEDGDYVVVERYGVFQNILDQRVDMWDNLCDAFLYLITEGYFNKEYLNGTQD